MNITIIESPEDKKKAREDYLQNLEHRIEGFIRAKGGQPTSWPEVYAEFAINTADGIVIMDRLIKKGKVRLTDCQPSTETTKTNVV